MKNQIDLEPYMKNAIDMGTKEKNQITMEPYMENKIDVGT